MRVYLEKKLNALWYGRSYWAYLLWPLSILFAWISYFRKKYYVRHAYRAKQKMVVIGNITVGGTGKTPLLIALVHYLKSQGKSVVVISRGYGRVSKQQLIVSADTSVALCGDEPALIFQATRVPVIVSANRLAAVQYAEKFYPQHLIICDDGLQDYRLQYDFTIAVIDAKRQFGNEMLLPAGPLREKIQRLKAVNCVIANGVAICPYADFTMQLQTCAIKHLVSGKIVTVAELQTFSPLLALTAIGHPERFFDSLSQLGLTFKAIAYPDHYHFIYQDIVKQPQKAIIVTAKDAVKLAPFAFEQLYVLEVTADLPEPFYHQLLTLL